MNPSPFDNVTWVKVEKPVFDLLGVLVSSLSFTAMLMGGCILVGGAFGVLRIWRQRNLPASGADLRLQLETH